MHALDINFAGHRRFGSALGLLLFAISVVAAAVVAIDYLDAREELERAEARQARLQRPAAASRQRGGAAPVARDESRAIERVGSQLRLPWDAMLREVELRSDPAVALLSVEAQGQTRRLHLTGEARTMVDVVAYVSRLRESPWIKTAYLSGHEEKQVGAVRVIRFSLDATWSAPL